MLLDSWWGYVQQTCDKLLFFKHVLNTPSYGLSRYRHITHWTDLVVSLQIWKFSIGCSESLNVWSTQSLGRNPRFCALLVSTRCVCTHCVFKLKNPADNHPKFRLCVCVCVCKSKIVLYKIEWIDMSWSLWTLPLFFSPFKHVSLGNYLVHNFLILPLSISILVHNFNHSSISSDLYS